MKSYDDILMSEEFTEFMTKRNEKNSAYWEKFLSHHPEMEDEFRKASDLFKVLTDHKKQKIDDRVKTQAANELLKRIDTYEKSKSKVQTIKFMPRFAVAVSVIAFICLTIAVLYLTDAVGAKKISFNEITVPSGEKSKVQLADGTVVWLNSDSKLRYPSSFNKRTREVILEGEGYFDVTKQKGTSFTVVTQDIRVIALGTIFNIKSYPTDKLIETTLIEGVVKLQQTSIEKKFSDILLKPNQRMVYRKAENLVNIQNTDKPSNIKSSESQSASSVTIARVNTNNIISWKDHLLIFNNESFEEIAVKMTRWYNIEVIILDDELKQYRYTGKFIHNETAEQVLKVINVTTPIIYRIDKNKIYIEKRKGKN